MTLTELITVLQTDIDEETGVVRRMNTFGPWNLGEITQGAPLRCNVWDGEAIVNVRVRAVNADSTGAIGDFILLTRIGPIWVGLARLRLA